MSNLSKLIESNPELLSHPDCWYGEKRIAAAYLDELDREREVVTPYHIIDKLSPWGPNCFFCKSYESDILAKKIPGCCDKPLPFSRCPADLQNDLNDLKKRLGSKEYKILEMPDPPKPKYHGLRVKMTPWIVVILKVKKLTSGLNDTKYIIFKSRPDFEYWQKNFQEKEMKDWNILSIINGDWRNEDCPDEEILCGQKPGQHELVYRAGFDNPNE